MPSSNDFRDSKDTQQTEPEAVQSSVQSPGGAEPSKGLYGWLFDGGVLDNAMAVLGIYVTLVAWDTFFWLTYVDPFNCISPSVCAQLGARNFLEWAYQAVAGGLIFWAHRKSSERIFLIALLLAGPVAMITELIINSSLFAAPTLLELFGLWELFDFLDLLAQLFAIYLLSRLARQMNESGQMSQLLLDVKSFFKSDN